MSRRKAILLVIISAIMIGGSYLLKTRHIISTVASPEPVVSIDGTSSSTFGMKNTDELIAFWKNRFGHDPHDFISLTYLAQSHIRKGRETGDVSEYQKAEAILRDALKLDPGYEPTLAYLSAALFVQHNFSGALELANGVYKTDPRALQALATIGDANLELGNYEEAQTAYEKLNAQNSSPAVYTRLARLTWLHGKPIDALNIMQQAINQSDELDLSGENLAWYHFQLGELYFNTGQLKQADKQYIAALGAFDNYYLALAGYGKVLAAQGNYTQAISSYEKAVAIIPQPDLLAALGDLYTVTNQPDKAKHEYDTVEFIGKLQAINQVVYNRQLALFYANHNLKVDQSLKMAQNELAIRKDIYAYDTAAWALYKSGRYAEASKTMQQAMKLGTQDAMLYYHAGMIARALGENEQAEQMLSRALKINPHFDILQARIAQATLTELYTERKY
jgi:tetratricopeptide (TPR) repeat protein